MSTNTVEIFLLLIIVGLLLKKETPIIARAKSSDAIILDSCALIDARIIDLAKDNFIHSELIIPAFILSELQTLADGKDAHKRIRARFGLDAALELQELTNVHAVIDREDFPKSESIDSKLIALAKKRSAKLYTTDFNLIKVAGIEGVMTLNINELAQHLRPTLLPDDEVAVKITQKGNTPGQGIGYLDNGTMIIVNGTTGRSIGKVMNVKVTRMHQTTAGKMIFAKPIK